MKHEKIDAVEVCKELEDLLAPRLKLSVLDRAVYSHLLRHSRFECKPRSNSHRNLVSCCLNCNPRKSDLPAADFLRQLFREGRLSAKDLSARLLAVQALAAGKLRPQVLSERTQESLLAQKSVVGQFPVSP